MKAPDPTKPQPRFLRTSAPEFEVGDLVRAISRVMSITMRKSVSGPGQCFCETETLLWEARGNLNHEQASFGLLNPDRILHLAFIALRGLHQRLKAAPRQLP